jgi:hypothetical protein
MNSFLIKTEYLATGNLLPFTGEWTNTALSKNALIVAYVSGSAATINLDGQSLINDVNVPSAYTFYTTTGVTNYMSPAFLDSPIPSIRLSSPSTGNSRVWAYITYQN